ncbi:MAG: hypothetical protein Q4D81_15565, partial [Eubacteriales bacterium]|nr:hypothetical protein [Eubacteriales bacterium]
AGPVRKSAEEAPQESTAGPVRKSVTGTAAGKGDGKGSGGRPQWLPGVCFLGLAWMVCVYAAPVFFTKVDYALESFHKNITGETALSSELQGILDVIAANTDPEDRITVHALKDIIYGKSERLSASRYSFQHAFETVDPAKNDEYFAELEADPPKLIVQGDPDPERMMEFITSHGYHWIATSESGEFRIYKRGDGDSASAPEWADSLCRTVSFTEYLDRLSGLEEERDLFVFFAVKGRPGKELSVKNADQLRELGFHDTDLLLDDDYHSFLGVSKGKECLYQSLGGSGADFYEGRIEGLEVSLASATKKRGNQASIAVGGVEYALDQRGFNIVVYDAETSTVIDSVAFDTHSGDTDCTR